MNLRMIFNPSYNFVGLILIAILITIILLLNKNIKYSIRLIGKTFLITGLFALGLAFLLNLSLDILIPKNYKIFVEVISKNVISNCIYNSLLSIGIGILCHLYIKFSSKKQIESQRA